eukprot:CAMPEP_0119555460 /NCGR_PEP_ID=MMETSP1352-20130426/7664_1 /TAXON_ID=265584 /ORGANISM="Stauroneis constricta, Strain CCMP1120" /LENGTH=425 /DNA_ID=CAMNT_0007602223 /DNA_START=135 /DNA_END=1412 /DNA_ORIENTATION=+
MLSRNDAQCDDRFERVARRSVNPITFEMSVDINYQPQIEEFWYDTTGPSLSRSSLPTARLKQSPSKRTTNAGTAGAAASATNQKGVRLAPPKKDGFVTLLSQANRAAATSSSVSSVSSSNSKLSSKRRQSSSNNSNNNGNGKGSTASSLGEFFVKDKIRTFTKLAENGADADNHSISSRSMSSRSIADRSLAERSKAEESLKQRAKNKSKRAAASKKPSKASSSSSSVSSTSSKSNTNSVTTTTKSRLRKTDVTSAASIAMHSIDEDSNYEDDDDEEVDVTSTKLGKFFHSNSVPEHSVTDAAAADMRSVASASTLGSSKSVSKLSQAELSRSERRLKDKEISKLMRKQPSKGVLKTTTKDDDDNRSLTLKDVKELRFNEEHDYCEVPELTNSMYDDLFYTEEELADFRYEAFMEEAGLDVNEYM